MSEKRHRLADSEIPEVIMGLKFRLTQLLEEGEEPGKAEVAYRCLRRLARNTPGRPKYDAFSWEYLQYYLDVGFEEDIKKK